MWSHIKGKRCRGQSSFLEANNYPDFYGEDGSAEAGLVFIFLGPLWVHSRTYPNRVHLRTKQERLDLGHCEVL